MNVPLPDVPEVRVVGLPQLTTGFDLVERLDLAMHLKVHGPLEPMTGERLAELAEAISLRGRGGAGFPVREEAARGREGLHTPWGAARRRDQRQ